MSVQFVVAAFVVTAGMSGPAFAQVAPSAAPNSHIRPSSTEAAKVAKKVNLNTASQKELETLPLIGSSPARAIIAARSEAKFKDWSDFVARNVVSKIHQDAIKDRIGF